MSIRQLTKHHKMTLQAVKKKKKFLKKINRGYAIHARGVVKGKEKQGLTNELSTKKEGRKKRVTEGKGRWKSKCTGRKQPEVEKPNKTEAARRT